MSYAIAQKGEQRSIEVQQWEKGYEELVGGLTYQMKWNRFKETVRQCGFQIGYLRKFAGHGWSYNGGQTNEEEIIFYNRKNGLILYANSFAGTAINQAVLYGEINHTSLFTSRQKALIAHCRTVKISGNVLSFSMEVGKGFKYYVSEVIKNFKFCTPWCAKKDLLFVNYMERETADRSSWKGYTQKKIEECNNELRALMQQ